jgi:hypothetical protein
MKLYEEKEEREGEQKDEWDTEGGITYKGRGTGIFPALKVPRQCPLVLLVEVNLRKGKASEKVKGWNVDCIMSRGEKFSKCNHSVGRISIFLP